MPNKSDLWRVVKKNRHSSGNCGELEFCRVRVIDDTRWINSKRFILGNGLWTRSVVLARSWTVVSRNYAKMTGRLDSEFGKQFERANELKNALATNNYGRRQIVGFVLTRQASEDSRNTLSASDYRPFRAKHERCDLRSDRTALELACEKAIKRRRANRMRCGQWRHTAGCEQAARSGHSLRAAKHR